MKNLIEKFSRKYPRHWEIFKFLLVGGLATLIDMLIMAAVIFILNREIFSYNFLNVIFQSGAKKDQILKFSSVLGTCMGFCISTAFNYIMSVAFVFDHKEYAKTISGASLFIVLSAIGFFIHMLGMWAFFELLKINYWIVKIAITVLVLIFNYVTRKVLIFRADKLSQPKAIPGQNISYQKSKD
ncbi:MAG TPA: GtrA family protein [Clostridia bacterium]|jgi:putative flippase GtrA